MTRRAVTVPLKLILGFALLVRAQVRQSEAAEPATTNFPAPQVVNSLTVVLTNAEQVHGLSRQEAAGGRKVLIRGVITCAMPGFDAAVVQDATGGIYIDQWNTSLGEPPRLGQLVAVEGVTAPGQFAPLIHAVSVNRLGTGELPPPVHPYWDQLINGSLDAQFVEIEGVVTAVRPEGVALLTHDGKINALIFDSNGSSNGLALQPYEGARIRLRGCLFASWDPATHAVNVTEVRMFTPSVTAVEPAPPDAFAVIAKKVSDLLQFDPQASALRRVKVIGQLVHERDGEYFAMDGKNGFRFILKSRVELNIGDLVEVVGFPSLTGPAPVLQEAMARKIGAAPLPNPLLLDASNLFRAENDALLVRINARLLNLSSDRRRLELQAGLQRFVALLDNNARASVPRSLAARTRQTKGVDLPLGSLVEVTGIYAGSGGNRTTGAEVANLEFLLNSAADIRVLTRPPFWTLPRLLILVGALLGVLAWALIWIRLLHHKVQQRTVQLQKEVHDREKAEQQRTLAQERARIARDLHDDLGSSLTEISMLATASPGIAFPPTEATQRMEAIAGKSRTLVHALDEIVWAVDPQRDTLASVAQYLASYVEEYLAGLKVACRVQIPNLLPDLVVPGEVRHHLFLAVKEALNNAVRHGGASEIGFRVRVQDDRLWISITDNGRGFEAVTRSNGNGLLNLRSRLEQLHGHCDLESLPGAGTTVSLQLPLSIQINAP